MEVSPAQHVPLLPRKSSSTVDNQEIRIPENVEVEYVTDILAQSHFSKHMDSISPNRSERKYYERQTENLNDSNKCSKYFVHTSQLISSGKEKKQSSIIPKSGYSVQNPKSLLPVNAKVKSEDRPWECEYCGSSFRLKHNLKTHMRVHTVEKELECPHCGKLFRERCDLIKHIKIHNGEKKYKCSQCELSFIFNWKLQRHLRTHSKEKLFACPHCDKTFLVLEYLKGHVRSVHQRERPYTCNICKHSFFRKKSLEQHWIRRHDTSKRPHECIICKKTFVTWYEYRMHKEKSVPKTCKECGVICECIDAVKNHMTIHPLGFESYYNCSECGKAFSKRKDIVSHIEDIHSDTLAKDTHFKSKLKKTINQNEGITSIHSKDVDKKAEIANKFVSTKKTLENKPELKVLPLKSQALSNQQNSKTPDVKQKVLKVEEKSYAKKRKSGLELCSLCGIFLCKYDLMSHMRLHNGEDSFICESCGKGFAEKKYLIAHKQMLNVCAPPFVPKLETIENLKDQSCHQNEVNETETENNALYNEVVEKKLPQQQQIYKSENVENRPQSYIEENGKNVENKEEEVLYMTYDDSGNVIYYTNGKDMVEIDEKMIVDSDQMTHAFVQDESKYNLEDDDKDYEDEHDLHVEQNVIKIENEDLIMEEVIEENIGTEETIEITNSEKEIQIHAKDEILNKDQQEGFDSHPEEQSKLMAIENCKVGAIGRNVIKTEDEMFKGESVDENEKLIVANTNIVDSSNKNHFIEAYGKNLRDKNQLTNENIVATATEIMKQLDHRKNSLTKVKKMDNLPSFKELEGNEVELYEYDPGAYKVIYHIDFDNNDQPQQETVVELPYQEESCHSEKEEVLVLEQNVVRDESVLYETVEIQSDEGMVYINVADLNKESYHQEIVQSDVNHDNYVYITSVNKDSLNSVVEVQQRTVEKTENVVAKKLLSCQKCDKQFIHSKQLEEHVKSEHMVNHQEQMPIVVNEKLDLDVKTLINMQWLEGTPDRPFGCPLCFKTYSLKQHYKAHMKTHTTAKPYECDICHKRVKEKCDFKKHMKTHSSHKPYACDNCGLLFRERNKALKHARTHQITTKNFRCLECGKDFAYESYLDEHMKVHLKVKPFPCTNCQKAFTKKAQLNSHLKTCLKPAITCLECNSNFKTEKSYDVHCKRSVCKKCNQNFNCFTKLNQHRAEGHDLPPLPSGPQMITCEVCEKSVLRWNYQIHLSSHGINKGEKCICDKCGEIFNLRQKLRKHLMKSSCSAS